VSFKQAISLCIALVVGAIPCASQTKVDGFVAKIYQTMPYRLFIPPKYDKAEKYPLIIWLHGAGSVGTDNFKQISGASLRGTHTWTIPANQVKHPAFVVAPQSTKAWAGDQLSLVLEILKTVQDEFNIDSTRIYVAGQSMGGYGVWNIITMKPDLFAAAIPLCGGGDPTQAARIAKIPVWAFHGTADPTVPVRQSQMMVAALKNAGGAPRYTEYKGVGHNVWIRAFQEPGLVDWLFAQHR
jgi:predicted peptidase